MKTFCHFFSGNGTGGEIFKVNGFPAKLPTGNVKTEVEDEPPSPGTSIDRDRTGDVDVQPVVHHDDDKDQVDGVSGVGGSLFRGRGNSLSSVTWPDDFPPKDNSSATVFLRLKSGSFRDIAQVSKMFFLTFFLKPEKVRKTKLGHDKCNFSFL